MTEARSEGRISQNRFSTPAKPAKPAIFGARELGLNRVRLDVRNANPKALRFYEAIGYSPEQTKMTIEVDRS